MDHRNGLEYHLKEFLGGLTRPSPAAFVVMVLATIMLSALLLLGATEKRMAPLLPYLASGETDEFLFVTGEILALREQDRHERSLVIMGGSATRASLSTENTLEIRLRRSLGGNHDVAMLSIPGMTIWEMEAVAESLPRGMKGTVILGVNPMRMGRSLEYYGTFLRSPRLGVASAAYDREVTVRLGKTIFRTGNYLFDNRAFFAPRLPHLAGNVLYGPPQLLEHRFIGRELPGSLVDRYKRRVRNRFALIKADYETNAAENFLSLSRVISLLRERRGLRVVLLEAPVNPWYVEDWGASGFFREHRQAVEEFARRQGTEYWRLDGEAGLSSSDFKDPFHINSFAAVGRYSAALIRRLAGPGGPDAVSPEDVL